MGTRLQLFLCIAAILFFVSTVYFIRKKGLDLYRSILWFIWAGILLIMGFFPNVVRKISFAVGIETPSNFVFLILIAFLLITCLSLSASLSRQHDRIKQLVQNVAILENKLEKLESKIISDEEMNKAEHVKTSEGINNTDASEK